MHCIITLTWLNTILLLYIIVIDENGKGFQGIFSGGSNVSNCSDGLTALVNFVCDPKADWNKLPDNNITKYAVASPIYEDCQVFFPPL